jgi:hypothetical protein
MPPRPGVYVSCYPLPRSAYGTTSLISFHFELRVDVLQRPTKSTQSQNSWGQLWGQLFEVKRNLLSKYGPLPQQLCGRRLHHTRDKPWVFQGFFLC